MAGHEGRVEHSLRRLNREIVSQVEAVRYDRHVQRAVGQPDIQVAERRGMSGRRRRKG